MLGAGMLNKVTIYGDPDGWILGVRAAKRLTEDYPAEQKSVIFAYGDPEHFVAYAKKNKAGISVWVTKS